jgi:hypothetical protein
MNLSATRCGGEVRPDEPEQEKFTSNRQLLVQIIHNLAPTFLPHFWAAGAFKESTLVRADEISSTVRGKKFKRN